MADVIFNVEDNTVSVTYHPKDKVEIHTSKKIDESLTDQMDTFVELEGMERYKFAKAILGTNFDSDGYPAQASEIVKIVDSAITDENILIRVEMYLRAYLIRQDRIKEVEAREMKKNARLETIANAIFFKSYTDDSLGNDSKIAIKRIYDLEQELENLKK